MVSLFVLFDLILAWSCARNIINGSKASDQFVKLVSEFSNEIALAIYEIWSYHGNDENHRQSLIRGKLADAIGDSMVVLVNVAAQSGLDIKTLWQSQNFPVFNQVPHSAFLIASMGQGRLADAVKKGNTEEAVVAIGIMLYGLELLCKEYHLTPLLCLQDAYNEIKDRKGVMYNGIFVKSDDANYERICNELGLDGQTSSQDKREEELSYH